MQRRNGRFFCDTPSGTLAIPTWSEPAAPTTDDRPSIFLSSSLYTDHSFQLAAQEMKSESKKTKPTTLFHEIYQITTELWRSLKLASLASVHILCIPFAAMCSSHHFHKYKHNKTMCSEPFQLTFEQGKDNEFCRRRSQGPNQRR